MCVFESGTKREMGTDQEVDDQRGNLLRANREIGVWKTQMKKWHKGREDESSNIENKDEKKNQIKRRGLLRGQSDAT